MFNFKKFLSVSAVAVLGATNLLTPLSYANAATKWYDELDNTDLVHSVLNFLMPDKDVYLKAYTEANHYFVEYSGTTKTSWDMPRSEFIYDLTWHLSWNAFEKVWYTFEGWKNGSWVSYADKAEVRNWTTTESGVVPIYAQWSANRYNITYELNDSTGTSTATHPRTPTSWAYDEELTIVNPSRTWYKFSGWYITNMDTVTHTIGTETSNNETEDNVTATKFVNLRADTWTVNFAARWSANTDTQYVVKHFLEKLEGWYPATPVETDELNWTTDDLVTPAVHHYSWFTDATPYESGINADWSTIFNYQYPRKSYDLTLIAGRWVESVKGTGTQNTVWGTTTSNTTISFKYDEPIVLSFTLKQWYQTGTWSGYENESSSFNMPANNIEKTAYATPITYTITYHNHWGTGNESDPTSYTVEDNTITLSDLTRLHSIFEWWTGSNGTVAQKGVTINSWSTWDKEFYAVWKCDTWYHIEQTGATNESCQADTDTQYLVNHRQEQLDWTESIYESGYEYWQTDSTTAVTPNTYDWFTAQTITQQTIKWDGTTVVDVHYTRNTYARTITETTGVNVTTTAENGGGNTWPYKYEDTVTLNANVASGYTFESWTVTRNDNSQEVTVTNNQFQMPATDVTIKANVTTNQYKIEYELNWWHEVNANETWYTVESPAINLNDPARDNSIFEWWTWTELNWTQRHVTIAHWSVWNRKYYAVWSCVPWYHDEWGTSCVANDYTVTINYNDGWDTPQETVNFKYNSGETIPEPTQPWYEFAWWTISWMSGWVTHTIGNETTTADSATGVRGTTFNNLTTENNGEVTFTAQWTAKTDTTYKVYHYTKDLTGTTYTLADSGTFYWTSDYVLTVQNLARTDLEWFTYDKWYTWWSINGPVGSAVTNVTIDKHWTTEIHLYYTRDTHHVYLSWDAHVVNLIQEGDHKYGEEVQVQAIVQSWYHFKEWRKKWENFTDL